MPPQLRTTKVFAVNRRPRRWLKNWHFSDEQVDDDIWSRRTKDWPVQFLFRRQTSYCVALCLNPVHRPVPHDEGHHYKTTAIAILIPTF